jgi:hypothetical protein
VDAAAWELLVASDDRFLLAAAACETEEAELRLPSSSSRCRLEQRKRKHGIVTQRKEVCHCCCYCCTMRRRTEGDTMVSCLQRLRQQRDTIV